MDSYQTDSGNEGEELASEEVGSLCFLIIARFVGNLQKTSDRIFLLSVKQVKIEAIS